MTEIKDQYQDGRIVNHYSQDSFSQQSAGDQLLSMIAFREEDDVLDFACGAGDLTAKIREKTKGFVKGLDGSEQMIQKAKEKHGDKNITFVCEMAEVWEPIQNYDVIFCNSSFHWFKKQKKILKTLHKGLKPSGIYAMQVVLNQEKFNKTFYEALCASLHKMLHYLAKLFHLPMHFFNTEKHCKKMLRDAGFVISYAKIHKTTVIYTVDQMVQFFEGGASNAYLNPDNYACDLPKGFKKIFLKAYKSYLKKKAKNNTLTLKFSRLFVIAHKA